MTTENISIFSYWRAKSRAMSTLNARDGALCANTVGRAQEVAALLLQVAAIHLLVAVFNDDVFCCAVLSGRFSMARFVVLAFCL
jgi:hypothetical protein